MKSEDSQTQAVGAWDAGDADTSVPESTAGPLVINKTCVTVKFMDGIHEVHTQLNVYDAVKNEITSGKMTPCNVGQRVIINYVKPEVGHMTLQITSQENIVSVRYSTESAVLVTLVRGVAEELFWDLTPHKMAWRVKETPGDNFVVSAAGMFKVGCSDKFTIYMHKSEPVSPEEGLAKRMHVSDNVSPEEGVAKRLRKPEGGVGGPG